MAGIGTPGQPELCTSQPMAHTNPASSRATATTALFFNTRRASRRLNFALNLSCAFQAMSVTALCQHRTTFPHFRRSKFPHPVAVPVLSRAVLRRAPFVVGQGRA